MSFISILFVEKFRKFRFYLEQPLLVFTLEIATYSWQLRNLDIAIMILLRSGHNDERKL